MMKKGGTNIKRPDYKSYIGGYLLLIDYTNITMAKDYISKGLPYLLAKG
jgi:2-keto-4-pentenoate hydratase/2-oxohepta-3-ene-1,7-dioic acid hydratase in catechol pathway